MSPRESERLKIVDKYYPDYDTVISRTRDIEMVGTSDCDLCCGQDGELLLRNFSVEEAQHHFGRKGARALMKCPSCHSYNLLAAAVEVLDDGSIVTLPRGE